MTSKEAKGKESIKNSGTLFSCCEFFFLSRFRRLVRGLIGFSLILPFLQLGHDKNAPKRKEKKRERGSQKSCQIFSDLLDRSRNRFLLSLLFFFFLGKNIFSVPLAAVPRLKW